MDSSTDPLELAAARLIGELDGVRTPEGVVRCLLRAFDRVSAAAGDLPDEEVVMRAEAMARDLLTAGLQSRRLAS
jgi:hypothetical protein